VTHSLVDVGSGRPGLQGLRPIFAALRGLCAGSSMGSETDLINGDAPEFATCATLLARVLLLEVLAASTNVTPSLSSQLFARPAR